MGASSNGKNGTTGGMRDLLKREKDPSVEARKAASPLQTDFPYVFELLGGIAKTATEDAVSPSTITFFANEGKIRFSVNVKSMKLTFIGEVEDVLNPWGSLNTALAMGDVMQREMREQGYTPKDAPSLPH